MGVGRAEPPAKACATIPSITHLCGMRTNKARPGSDIRHLRGMGTNKTRPGWVWVRAGACFSSTHGLAHEWLQPSKAIAKVDIEDQSCGVKQLPWVRSQA